MLQILSLNIKYGDSVSTSMQNCKLNPSYTISVLAESPSKSSGMNRLDDLFTPSSLYPDFNIFCINNVHRQC